MTFSIPYRIELAVTREHDYIVREWDAFSIPYRIELAVTLQRGPAVVLALYFQYPLSDRTRCNNRASHLLSENHMTFSIPYRIELAVTHQTGCGPCTGIQLSVSPIGSNSL